ncbi:MAG: GIY-YIG nuclease family protein [Bacteroidetes bacterium]|nr:MAG: GIY-YIG nuclease family protein [Bacteroidota bacterium]
MKYFVYIIYSKNIDKFYIGFTKNISERIRKHNSNHKGFTGKTNDWVIVYNEEFKTKSEAYSREREIKSWKNRNKITELIKNNNE